jgi:NAD(P)-dependent dehydrogenase (short-subunit alcohol dehydrogenase family)
MNGSSLAAAVAPGALVICADCRRLKGAIPGGGPRLQRCGCRAEGSERPVRTWSGYDHNTYAELCRCCGLVLLPSGSKWSVWFCADCKPLILAFNRAVGRYVVPIGRHSIMNHVGGRGTDLASKEAVERFVQDVRTMIGGIDALAAIAGDVIARNLAALGFDAAADVPLTAYLRAVQQSDLTHHAAFVTLVLSVLSSPPVPWPHGRTDPRAPMGP